MAAASFDVTERRDMFGRRRWRWNLVAENGEPIATSEAYNSLEAALDGARAVQLLAPGARLRVPLDGVTT